MEEIRILIEADVERLLELEFKIALTPELELYRQSMLAFHRGDINALENIKNSAQDFSEISTLIELRRGILKRDFTQAKLVQLFESSPQGPWKGEFLILCAAAFESINDFVTARKLHIEAVPALEAIGAFGKSLRSRSNAIANLSCIEPERKMLAEYNAIYREARKLRQNDIMATTLLNLSREYHRMGAHKMALKTCHRSIAANRGNAGTLIYFLAIVSRAHIYFDLGRKAEAETDLELARGSGFTPVQAACQTLDALMGQGEVTEISVTSMLPSWKERLEARDRRSDDLRSKLSPLEESLVRFLAASSRGKFEITDHLFGAKLHPFTAENRLKNLIHRIRKKHPGLIIFENDLYSLSEVDHPLLNRAG